MSLLLVISLLVNSYLISHSSLTKEEAIVKIMESIYGDTDKTKMAFTKKMFTGKLLTEGVADRLYIIDNANNTIGSKYETRKCKVNILVSPGIQNNTGDNLYLVQLSIQVKGVIDRWYNKEFIMYEGDDGIIYSLSKWDL